VAPVGWWNNTKYLNKKELIPVPYTNMAAISLFWYTNMAAVTSDENDLYILRPDPNILILIPPSEVQKTKSLKSTLSQPAHPITYIYMNLRLQLNSWPL
jgi:hypothetical protein